MPANGNTFSYTLFLEKLHHLGTRTYKGNVWIENTRFASLMTSPQSRIPHGKTAGHGRTVGICWKSMTVWCRAVKPVESFPSALFEHEQACSVLLRHRLFEWFRLFVQQTWTQLSCGYVHVCLFVCFSEKHGLSAVHLQVCLFVQQTWTQLSCGSVHVCLFVCLFEKHGLS